MRSKLEENVNIDSEENNNDFAIPDELQRHRIVKNLLKYHLQEHHPIVVNEETYTRISVARKFYPAKPSYTAGSLVEVLIAAGFLKPKTAESFSYIREPVDNKSFAECVSMFYRVPVNETLISEEDFNSERFMQLSPRQKVQTLFRAYNGAKWFEIFKQRLKKNRNVKTISAWHLIRLQDLPYILGTGDFEPNDSRYNLNRLIKKGFIIPSGKKFIHKSTKNIVNNEALAELISLSKNQNFEETYTSGKEVIDYLVSSYIRNRLVPFFKKYGIDFDVLVPVGDAERILGFLPGTIYKALEKRRAKNPNKESERIRISGVDLAIYSIKPTKRYTFSLEEIAETLGAEKLSKESIGIYREEKEKYSRNQFFPIYDFIAEKAREKLYRVAEIVRSKKGIATSEQTPHITTELKPQITLDNDSDETIKINGETYTLSREGKITYCETYGIYNFNRVSMQHIRDNLQQSHFKGRKIICPEVIFTQRKRDGKIYSAKINRSRAPIASESRLMNDLDYDFNSEEEEASQEYD